MTTYQADTTVTGAMEVAKLIVSCMEMKKYDGRISIAELLEMGGPLDAPDAMPAGFMQNNDGDALVVTVSAPGATVQSRRLNTTSSVKSWACENLNAF